MSVTFNNNASGSAARSGKIIFVSFSATAINPMNWTNIGTISPSPRQTIYTTICLNNIIYFGIARIGSTDGKIAVYHRYENSYDTYTNTLIYLTA